MAISPTTEGFRAAFRRPSLTLAEIVWRWTAGATTVTLIAFGLVEYLDTLPVTNGELLFLRSRQPYLVSEAIAHILRGSLNRVVIAGLLAGLLLGMLWIVAASVGRISIVRALLDYFRRDFAARLSTTSLAIDGEPDVATNVSANGQPLPTLLRLNFLRVAVSLAAVLGFVGASILARFVSPDANPQPALAFFVFVPLAAVIYLAWSTLNWLFSLAGMFAVRDGKDVVGAIAAAVSFGCEHTGPVLAVSAWTGLAHVVAIVSTSTVASMPLGFVAVVPWRLVVVAIILVILAYFALADWLYVARLAGYVCIAEMPEALLLQLPPPPQPKPAPPVLTSIDRDEPILSDLPNLAVDM
jgi:hypothetical protein